MKLLVGTWILWAAFVVRYGRLPSPYLVHVRHLPPLCPYPTSGVLLVLLFMAIQVAARALLIRPRTYSRSWLRAGLALFVSGVFFIFAGMGAMRAPPYFFGYIWWLLG